MGLIVAFEGADNSGKSTMIQLVKNHLTNTYNLNVTIAKFPDYTGETGSVYGKEIYRMLNNEHPSRFKDPEFVAEFSRLQIYDKHAAIDQIKLLQNDYDVVLVDRFLLSLIIYDIMHSVTTLHRNHSSYNEDILDTMLTNNEFPNISDAWEITFSQIYTKDCKEKLITLLETFHNIPYVVFDKTNSKIFLDMVRSKNRIQDGLDVQTLSQRIVEKLYTDICKTDIHFLNFNHIYPVLYNRYFSARQCFLIAKKMIEPIRRVKYDQTNNAIRKIHDRIHETIDSISLSICEKICNYIVNFNK